MAKLKSVLGRSLELRNKADCVDADEAATCETVGAIGWTASERVAMPEATIVVGLFFDETADETG